MKIFLRTKIIACYFLFIIKYRYHKNETFLGQNLLLVPFVFDEIQVKYRYQRNEIFLRQNLLLVPFVYDSKKLEKNV